ncbi:MAG TPA: ATP-binding protein [Mucilaginibacter sp.]|jgi:signal transduction histidine kinase/ActR/RegA family two-component response regulator
MKKFAYLLTIIVMLSSDSSFGSVKIPVAKKGVIDFRSDSFSDNLNLDGEWLFYRKQLLNPQEVLRQPGEFIHFPELWSKQHLPSFGYATYSLTILLPKHHAPLEVSIANAYCAYRLFANDNEVASNGQVSTSPAGFVPHWIYKAFDVPERTDTLRLVLQVANFAHSKGGVKQSLMIGQKENIELDRERGTAIDLLLAGCLLMGGLFFLGLYLLGKRDKAILLFSLFAMVYSYRMIGCDNYVLHTLLPHLSWYLTVRMEYFSFFASMGLFGLYTKSIYPEEGSTFIINTISGISFLFSIVALCSDPLFFTRLVDPFLILMVFFLVYIPYIYLQAYRKKRAGSVYTLASTLALMSVFAITLFQYWRIIPQFQFVTFLGYISFFFLQSLVLSHRVSFALKQANEQAQQGLVTKGEFLSTMSHEIRTPLNSVIGISHLLLKNDPREDQKEQLDVMIFSANNLLNIVNDVLDYSKIEAGKVTFERIEMDIAALAKNLINGMQAIADDKGIDLRLSVEENLKNRVLGDPTRTTQVITNLVHNAIKFTIKGEVLFDISVKEQDDEKVTLQIKVIDTGIGISKEKQAAIFERFTQADSSTSRGFGGTGLGLSISKKILELQGSSLQLTSTEDKGSTFYFVQSFEKGSTISNMKKPDISPNKDEKAFSGFNILLVDDNSLNLMVAQSFLKRWGAGVDIAHNGEEAIKLLDVSKHDLVLMDLHMPVMDGYEASRRIREQRLKIPIIALTATLPSEIKEQLSKTGFDDIIVKPFLPDELYSKVFAHIFKKQEVLTDFN